MAAGALHRRIAPARRLVVMVKEPHPGRVKTRLAREIGTVPAAWWFRHQAADLLRRIEDPRWQTILAVTPDPAGMASRVWPPHLARLPQGGGDLGRRMARALHLPGPTLVIGSDIPDIAPRHIARAFAALARADMVVGPALDGGYWLIGLRRVPPPGLFAGVRWSGPHALADTLASAAGLRIACVDALADVDSGADLRRLRRFPRPGPRASWSA